MIELAEVIAELRRELDSARASGEGSELQFELGPIELEVTMALEKQGGAGAKVRFWVVELGGDARANTTNTQRIKLMLKPTLPGPTISERPSHRVSAHVSGGEASGEQ